MKLTIACAFLAIFLITEVNGGKKKCKKEQEQRLTNIEERLTALEEAVQALQEAKEEEEEEGEAGNPQVVPRQARQSSTSYGGVAERAIDGNWESDWSGASCTATAGGPNQWLEVEYESLVKVTRVKMQNRRNCCPDRLHDVLITVDGVECGFFKGPGTDGQLVTVDCHRPLKGTVVRFQQNTGTNIMTLCEVGIE